MKRLLKFKFAVQQFHSFVFILIFFSLSQFSFAEQTFEQTAIASPQSEEETDNTELLRQRAVNNAIELALIKYQGVVISTDKKESRSTDEKLVNTNGKTQQTVNQQRQSDTAVHVQTSGIARLLEITEEKYVGDDYLIRAKIIISDKNDAATIDAGYFWLRAGKPEITLKVEEISAAGNDNLTGNSEAYLISNFDSNGIELTNAQGTEPPYTLEVTQNFDTKEITDYDTFTTHCNIVFTFTDNTNNKPLFSLRDKNGPKAGFSIQQSHQDCISEIMPGITQQALTSVAGFFDEQWRLGTVFAISIDSLDGKLVDRTLDAIKRAYAVNGYTDFNYEDQTMKVNISYKGDAQQLIQTLRQQIEPGICPLKLTGVDNQKISFNCKI